jgi:glycosyltransferase involved in cell wall biosynthesis
MFTSIVIPVHNANRTLSRTLDSLLAQEWNRPTEVLLVDDHSTDGCIASALAHPLSRRWSVRVVANEKSGLSNGYNIGIESASGEIVVIMHSDCYVPDPSALKNLLAPFDDPEVVATVPRIVVPPDDWATMSFWDKVASARYTNWDAHGFLGKFDGMRRATMLEIGGFDAGRFHVAGEDADIILRLESAWKMVKTEVRVVHAHCYPPDASLRSFFRKQRQLGEGFGALLRKHGLRLNREYWMLLAVHSVKIFLCAMSLIPFTALYALTALFLMGVLYAGRALKEKDPRVLLAPFAHMISFYVTSFAILKGLFSGKQRFDYNLRHK